MSLLKCPKCGEMFSDSYKECPFCAEDEENYHGVRKKRSGHRVQRQKSPSILGPALLVVVLFLAAFLVYTFFGDKIARIFDKQPDKPSITQPVEPTPNTPEPAPSPATVSLDHETLTLVEGASGKLTAAGADGGLWTSSNTAVAAVSDDGTVTARAVGTATITVSSADGSATASCAVTVEAKKELKLVIAYESGYTMAIADNDVTVDAGRNPYKFQVEGATGTPTWTVADPSIVEVSEDGSINGLQHNLAGTTMTVQVDGQTLTCTVRVD